MSLKALQPNQIKVAELQLLQTNGSSLGDHSEKRNNKPLLKRVYDNNIGKGAERLAIDHISSAGFTSNANLRVFAIAMLRSIYQESIKEDLLHFIKSILYTSTINLASIHRNPCPRMTSEQMKKLMVEFLYYLEYSDQENKVQLKLTKYPIILDILVLFLRIILVDLNMKNAQSYLLTIDTKKAYKQLIDYFDLNCKIHDKLFMFYEDRIFILENQNGEIFMGNYYQNQNQKQLKLSNGEEILQMKYENNRGLQLRGIVGESLILGMQPPTPFFNDSELSSSFQSSDISVSMISQVIEPNHVNLMKTSKQMSLLKMLDRAPIQQISAFGNLKRAMGESQLKQSMEYRMQYLTVDNPHTANSPLTYNSPFTDNSPLGMLSQCNFAPRDQGYSDEGKDYLNGIKVMKRSKSQYGDRIIIQDEIDPQFKKHNPNIIIKIVNPETLHEQNQFCFTCTCTSLKKQRNRLVSGIYELNLSYVLHQILGYEEESSLVRARTSPFATHNSTHTKPAKVADKYMHTLSRGINFQTFASSKFHELTVSRQMTPKRDYHDNQSLKYGLFLPSPIQSSVHGRDFSPISDNDGRRSLSPIGSMPRIVFNYSKPLRQPAAIDDRNEHNFNKMKK